MDEEQDKVGRQAAGTEQKTSDQEQDSLSSADVARIAHR